jgi:hypothetical protein
MKNRGFVTKKSSKLRKSEKKRTLINYWCGKNKMMQKKEEGLVKMMRRLNSEEEKMMKNREREWKKTNSNINFENRLIKN